MGGGMMGGMGGMGGGMGGGMMGGMGGMGGGMGGGMFAVPDDLKLGPKTKGAAPTTKAVAPAQRARQPKSVAPAKNPAPAAATRPAAKATAIELKIAAGSDPETAWNDYLAAHEDVSPETLRETTRQLWHAKKFSELSAMIRASLRAGHPQPWMYEVLSLAMRASGSSDADIERALMSGADFGSSSDDLMYVAQYLARIRLDARALKVFREVSILEPLRPEPYLYGLQLATRLGDVDGIRWSSLGILKQAWPKDKSQLVEQAKRASAAAIEQLKRENRKEEAAQFQAELNKASIRDCRVVVSWTGDADVDVMIEEPSGAICAFRNPRTSGGGVLLGDNSSEEARGAGQATTETYECPEAFNGTYRVLLRRVWGKVTAGKVTVDVYAYYGTPDEKHLRDQVPLGEQDALVVFDLQKGRRQEPISERQLANAAAEQLAVNQAILAQQVNQAAGSSSGASASLGVSRQGLLGIPFINQAVGYQPQITVLPSGTMLRVSGVVSADRKYVRVSPMPLFSGVSSVTTYNLIQGSTATSSGGGLGGTQPGQSPPGGGGGSGLF
ncbi:MAG TPA: hypothetical protein VFW87_05870, partial [Pirellulales bacterium]|nr:hypothetical protein [Pirellulales bacterium]